MIHDRGRGPEIVGTRITVYTIMHYLEGGRDTPEQIAELLRITPEEMAAALEYIKQNKEAVTAEYHKIEERIARGNPPEIQAKLDAIHARFVQRRREAHSLNGEEHEGNSAGHGH